MDIYRDSTWVLEFLIEQEKKPRLSGSLQTLVLGAHKKYKLKTNPKHVYAIVSSAWAFRPFIEHIIDKSGIIKDIPNKKGKPIYQRLTIALLIHDLLFSKSKRIQMGKHPIKKFVLSHKARLNAELAKLKIKHHARSTNDLLAHTSKDSDSPPVRWFRINPIQIQNGKSVDSVLDELKKKFTKTVEHWKDLVPGSIYHDEYIPYLFGIHPSEGITSHELYKTGKIIIQDRASCFPAHILNPTSEDIIIDACAAPGNKTTHATSYMYTSGDLESQCVHAFEKNPERAETLKKMIEAAGAKNYIDVNVGDFTEIGTPEKFPDTTGLIVDPSCSGSGIFGRKFVDSLNRNKNNDEEVPDEQEVLDKEAADLETRLTKLSSFQFQIVKHALSFPKAKKVVYSTCSIHAEENERVVIDLLLDKKVKKAGWKVAPRSKVIPDWPRRGLVGEFQKAFERASDDIDPEQLADGCIRALPKEDGGIGFFAVCFERDI